MLWYSDGAIHVAANGQVATGAGTAFLRNVRVGDGLTIAGSASMHEVTNIASDTQLTFSPPYTGAAGAAKQYRIAPIQGYVKEAADLLRSLTQNLGAFANSPTLQSLAELQGSAGQVLRFKSAGELEAFLLGTAAAKDVTASATDITAGRLLKAGDGGWMGDVPASPLVANLDDKAMRGYRYFGATSAGAKPPGVSHGHILTFGNAGDAIVQELWPLTGVPGKTYSKWYRQTFGNGAWGPWVTPNGEQGSNANGAYFKFSSGLLICKHLVTLDGGGAVKFVDWTYPAQYSSKPYVDLQGEQGLGTNPTSFGRSLTYQGQGDASARVQYVSPSTVTGHLIAIGQWN